VDAIIQELVTKFNGHAPAKDFDGLLAGLSKIPVSPYAAYGVGTDVLVAEKVTGARSFITSWQDYLLQSEAGNAQAASSALQQLIQLSAQFTAIPRSSLIELLNKAPEVSAKADSDTVAIDNLTQQLVAAVDAAKSPGDMDAIMAKIGATSVGNGYSSRGRDNAKRLQNLKFFAQNWQDYLVALTYGHPQDAQNDLRGLTNANYDDSFYPRSKILALMSPAAAAAAAPKSDDSTALRLLQPSALNLGSLDEFIAEIATIKAANGYQTYFMAHGLQGLEYDAAQVRTALLQLKNGSTREALGLNQNMGMRNGLGEYESAFDRMIDDVVVMAIPVAVQAPASLQPTPQERASAYFDRITKAAIDSKDWSLATRILGIRVSLGDAYGNREECSADLAAFQSFARGMSLEEAGQWADAVINYVTAIGGNSTHIPVREVGSRLARIKSAHPAEYEAGEAIILRRYSDGSPYGGVRRAPVAVPAQGGYPPPANPASPVRTPN
jgi:hypothetical protein